MQQFCLPILPSLLLILSSRPVLFCKKGVRTDFAKFTTKYQKKDFGTDVFFMLSCEISNNIFF